MMKPATLKRWMKVRGIEVVGVEDGKLIVSAPTGAMADSVLSVLLTHKKQLITDYKEALVPKVTHNIKWYDLPESVTTQAVADALAALRDEMMQHQSEQHDIEYQVATAYWSQRIGDIIAALGLPEPTKKEKQ